MKLTSAPAASDDNIIPPTCMLSPSPTLLLLLLLLLVLLPRGRTSPPRHSHRFRRAFRNLKSLKQTVITLPPNPQEIPLIRKLFVLKTRCWDNSFLSESTNISSVISTNVKTNLCYGFSIWISVYLTILYPVRKFYTYGSTNMSSESTNVGTNLGVL